MVWLRVCGLVLVRGGAVGLDCTLVSTIIKIVV